MNFKKIGVIFIFCIHTLIHSASGHVYVLPINDTLLRPWFYPQTCGQFAFYGETGVGIHTFNDCGSRVNSLALYQSNQNALAMLAGFCPDSVETELLDAIDATDNGIRGHICLNGDIHERFGGMFQGSWQFCSDFLLHVFVPVYSYQLKNLIVTDLTQDLTQEDDRVKILLTDTIVQQVQQLGNLSLCNWDRTGIGDITLFVEWFRDFPQQKEMIKTVRLNWRLGLGIPSGAKEDENLLFAFPFGNDGSFSLPFGIGLDVTYNFPLRIGFDVQLTHIFGNARARRIKTDVNQTDLLLLQTARVYKDFGLIQRFNLYGELHKLLCNTSLLFGYQFYKQGTSELSTKGNQFSNAIANTAQSLREWTVHNLFLKIHYDGNQWYPQRGFLPEVSVYARMPFNGQRSIANTAVGGVISVAF